MEAFSRSWALGVRYLEFDVQLTRDGVPVLFHDKTITRLTGRPERVADLTLDQLARIPLADNQWVPTLADVLHAYPDAHYMVDMKDMAAVEATLRLLTAYGAVGRSCLAGCWDGVLAGVRAEYPEISNSLGWRQWTALLASGHTRIPARWRPNAEFAHVPARWGRFAACNPSVIRRAHDLGLRVIVWGAEDTGIMRRLLDNGADGLITNRPDLLRDVLIARGQWLSTPRGAGASAAS